MQLTLGRSSFILAGNSTRSVPGPGVLPRLVQGWPGWAISGPLKNPSKIYGRTMDKELGMQGHRCAHPVLWELMVSCLIRSCSVQDGFIYMKPKNLLDKILWLILVLQTSSQLCPSPWLHCQLKQNLILHLFPCLTHALADPCPGPPPGQRALHQPGEHPALQCRRDLLLLQPSGGTLPKSEPLGPYCLPF